MSDSYVLGLIPVVAWFVGMVWALRESDRTGAVLIPVLIFFAPFIILPLLLAVGGLSGIH